MILIKSFLTGTLYDRFKLIYANLNEEDKAANVIAVWNWWYRLIIQYHSYVSFSTIFFINYVSPKRFYWYKKILQSITIFKQRGNHEVSHYWNFCMKMLKSPNSNNNDDDDDDNNNNSNNNNNNCNSTHS